jgi:hypothetical protein
MTDGRAPLAWLFLLIMIPLGAAALLSQATFTGRQSPLPSTTGLRAALDVSANISWFVYDPMGGSTAASAIQYNRGDPAVLALTVFGTPRQPRGAATALVYAYLSNGTGKTVEFGPQTAVHIRVRRDGRPWQELVLGPPQAGSLAPGEQAQVSRSLHLDGPGRYDLWAELVSRGDAPAFTFSS